MADVIAQYPIEVAQTLQIYRGDATIPIKFSILTPSGTAVPLDPFGTTWTAQLRATPDGALAGTFTVDASTAASGYITLGSLDGDTTSALVAGETYGADIQVTGGSVSPITVWRMSFYVEGDYTQP